jgi:hypothetical protein
MEDLDNSYYFRLYCSRALEEIQEIEKAKGEEECDIQPFFVEDNPIFKVLVNEKSSGIVGLHEFRVYQCFNTTFFAHYIFHQLPYGEVVYINSHIDRLDDRLKRLLDQYENEF